MVARDGREEMGQVTGPVGVDTVQGPLLLHGSEMEELEAAAMCKVWISSSVTCPVAQASRACSIPAGAGEVSQDLLLRLAWGDMRRQPWQGGWVHVDARGAGPSSTGFCREQALTGTPVGHRVSPRGSGGLGTQAVLRPSLCVPALARPLEGSLGHCLSEPTAAFPQDRSLGSACCHQSRPDPGPGTRAGRAAGPDSAPLASSLPHGCWRVPHPASSIWVHLAPTATGHHGLLHTSRQAH